MKRVGMGTKRAEEELQVVPAADHMAAVKEIERLQTLTAELQIANEDLKAENDQLKAENQKAKEPEKPGK